MPVVTSDLVAQLRAKTGAGLMDCKRALTSTEVSNDGKYLIYQIAKSGSDWNEILVKNIEI